jgi:hypothetical protein
MILEKYAKWRYGRSIISSKGLKKIYFSNISNIYFIVSNDSRLHLGDKFILEKICKHLNSNFNLNEKSAILIKLSTIKFLDINSDDFMIGIDWSKPLLLNIYESIEYFLNSYFNGVQIFNDANVKLVGVSSKIASSNLRIFGLHYRINYLSSLFEKFGFKIIYFDDYKISNHPNCIKSIEHGIDILKNNNIYALICFDNYWMHVAKEYNVKVYIIQRRKLNFTNLINHISSINTISGCQNLHYVS